MIVKEKAPKKASNYKQQWGDKVENDVAFYLRRHFAEDKNVFIYHDLRIEFKSEAAQIDHLIVYRKGFIIIESKSIKGKVQVNEALEWQRTVRERWVGMPSPITQAELQAKLLKQLLNENAPYLLTKMLMLQGYFGGRCWDKICAASNDAIIERQHMPAKLSPQIVKAEHVAKRAEEIIASRNNILKPNPSFSDNELKNIKCFLLAAHKPLKSCDKLQNEKTIEEEPEHYYSPDTQNTKNTTAPLNNEKWFPCKECLSLDTEPKYGKFGYYVQCNACKKNTSMNQACPSCGNKKTRVSKNKMLYTVSCNCGMQTLFTFKGITPIN